MDESTIEIRRGSDRNFGVVFSCVFALIGGYLTWKSDGVAWWAFIVAGIFLTVALIRPSWLSVPNKLWFKLGILLGNIIAPLVMGVVFFATVVPIGLIFRLRGTDLLNLKLEEDTASYWIERKTQPQSMKNQF